MITDNFGLYFQAIDYFYLNLFKGFFINCT